MPLCRAHERRACGTRGCVSNRKKLKIAQNTQWYMAYNPTYLYIGFLDSKLGQLENFLDFRIASLIALYAWLDATQIYGSTKNHMRQTLVSRTCFKEREENLCHVRFLDPIIGERIGKQSTLVYITNKLEKAIIYKKIIWNRSNNPPIIKRYRWPPVFGLQTLKKN